MDLIAWLGGVFILVVVLCPGAVGSVVCRLGKRGVQDSTLRVSRGLANGIYSEARAPRLLRRMGAAIVAQGLAILAIARSFR